MNISISQWIKNYAGVCTLILLCAGLYLKLMVFMTSVQIDLDMHDINRAALKVYWASEPGQYSETEMRQISVNKGRHHYSLSLPVLPNPAYIRIDPIDRKGQVVIHEILIKKPGYKHAEFNDKQEFSSLSADERHIESLTIDQASLSFSAIGNDPKLIVKIDAQPKDLTQWIKIASILLLIAFMCFMGYQVLLPCLNKLIYVPLLGIVIIGLCFTMALNSKIGTHPDEALHEKGVAYYKLYNLPPALDAPEAENSFSIYGVSRLASFEIFYPLAGYFNRITDFFNLKVINASRLFNITLIVLLFALSLRYLNFRYFMLPMLTTAQAWYLFSYSNSDALGIFICILVSYQIAFERSLFNRYLTQNSPPYFGITVLFLALLFGTLLLLKVNYYFFALFAGLFVLWRYAIGEFVDKKLFWKRLILLVALGLTPFGIRYGLDIAVNGPDRDELYTQMREKHAEPAFKPSRPLEGSAGHLYLRAKGTSAMELHTKHRWAERSFRTAFGSYGYTQYHAPDVLYDWVRYGGLFVLLLICSGILLSGSLANIVILFLAGGCSALLIAASFYNSWTVALQPQGRYLMAILPILGILYYQFRHLIWQRGLVFIVLLLFLLASFSFIFFALPRF